MKNIIIEKMTPEMKELHRIASQYGDGDLPFEKLWSWFEKKN